MYQLHTMEGNRFCSLSSNELPKKTQQVWKKKWIQSYYTILKVWFSTKAGHEKKKKKGKKTNTRKCDLQSGKRVNGNWLGFMLDLTKTSHCYKYVQIIKGRAHNTQQIENLKRETEKKSQTVQ